MLRGEGDGGAWKELYSIVAEVEEGIRKCYREKVVVEGIILYCCRGRGRNYKLLHRRGIMVKWRKSAIVVAIRSSAVVEGLIYWEEEEECCDQRRI